MVRFSQCSVDLCDDAELIPTNYFPEFSCVFQNDIVCCSIILANITRCYTKYTVVAGRSQMSVVVTHQNRKKIKLRKENKFQYIFAPERSDSSAWTHANAHTQIV